MKTASIHGLVWLSTFALSAGCAKDDPFAEDGGDGSGDSTGGGTTTATTTATTAGTSASTSASTSADTGSMSTTSVDESGNPTSGGACPGAPTRMIVFGDSIFSCFNVGGPDAETCSSKILHTWVNDNVGPLAYESHAVNGAVTEDVAVEQLPGVEVGMPGHTIILVFIGGNDLQPYIFASDEETMTDYAMKRPILDMHWETIFSWANDPANFPDGTTFFMNTQYNPFDDCTADPYNLSQVKIDLLGDFNDDLGVKANSVDGYIADIHAAFLGHGHHYQVDTCPYYIDGADFWMIGLPDLIHPNATGHAHIGSELVAVAEQAYAACD